MAEAFSNKLVRAAGIVTTSSAGSIGALGTTITNISTGGVAVGNLVDNANFIAGTKVTVIGSGQVTVDRASTNTATATGQNVKFLAPTEAYASPSATKSILIGVPVSYLFFVPFFFAKNLNMNFWLIYGLGFLLLVIGYFVHKYLTSII